MATLQDRLIELKTLDDLIDIGINYSTKIINDCYKKIFINNDNNFKIIRSDPRKGNIYCNKYTIELLNNNISYYHYYYLDGYGEMKYVNTEVYPYIIILYKERKRIKSARSSINF